MSMFCGLLLGCVIVQLKYQHPFFLSVLRLKLLEFKKLISFDKETFLVTNIRTLMFVISNLALEFVENDTHF